MPKIWSLIFALLLVCLGAARAFAFVLEGPEQRPWPVVEDIDRAARWDVTARPLVMGGRRGLGGGLEVSIDASVCTRLTILDHPDCATVRAVLLEAARRWEDGHPTLRFTDVSAAIPVEPQGTHPPRDGQGAEVDVFAASPEEFAPFQAPGIGAMTVYYFDVDAHPTLTNGLAAPLAAGTLQAADIRLSTAACYYIDEAFRRFGCAHLPSIMMHEVGHVLGIDHPDERPDRNIDSDDNPGNPMPIQCRAPRTGLQASSRIEAGATAIAQVWGTNAWRRGLTNDDIAARDALYPHCAIETLDRGGPLRWGAFARAADGSTLSVIGAPSEGQARAQLDEACARRGDACMTLAAFSGCFAYAEGQDGAAAGATGSSVAEARTRALEVCAEAGGTCQVREAFCAFE